MARLEMTEEQFNAAIAAAATAGAEAAAKAFAAIQAATPAPAPAAPPPNRGPLNIEDYPGQYATVMREARNRKVTDDPELVPCRSESGATFKAQTNKLGTIITLIDYKEPPESLLYQSAGGHVPDGSPIYDDDKRLAPSFKQWRYETYWLADLRYFIGKTLASRAHCVVRPETPAEAPAGEIAAE